MELTHDWKRFQDLFSSPRRVASAAQTDSIEPIYLVVDRDTIVSVLCENEDLSDWVGASYTEISGQVHHRDLIAFDRANVDRVMEESLSQSKFYDQVEFLREKSRPSQISQAPAPSRFSQGKILKIGTPKHFLITALAGWWARVLPSNFGIYVRLEDKHGRLEQDFFMVFKKGRFEGFMKPDLTSMGAERAKQPREVIKYLSEKYLVKVQSFVAYSTDWNDWSRSPHPWNEVALALKSNRLRMVPFKWGIAVIMSLRGFLGL